MKIPIVLAGLYGLCAVVLGLLQLLQGAWTGGVLMAAGIALVWLTLGSFEVARPPSAEEH